MRKSLQFVLLLFLAMAVLSVGAELSIAKKSKPVQNQTVQPIILNESIVRAEFDRIAAIPYDVDNYNCKNKSEDFARFLKQNNQTGIKIMVMVYRTNEYSHEVVLWNGCVYDPTNYIYRQDLESYYSDWYGYGFTGMRIIYDY